MILEIRHPALLHAFLVFDNDFEEAAHYAEHRMPGLEVLDYELHSTEWNELNNYLLTVEFEGARYGRLFAVACGKHADYNELLSEPENESAVWQFRRVVSVMRERFEFL